MKNSDYEGHAYMRRALNLAEQGRGRTSPNPLVGALVVKDGVVAGEGFHAAAGGAHAEVHALESAGAKARKATLYTTLEPCPTGGRTPPCTQAIIAAGISEVVVGLIDPNPRVSGKGIGVLKEAGLSVRTGVFEEEVARQNEAYIKHITTGMPFVLMKVAMSLDGKITSPNGEKWITGRAARAEVHRIRDEYDAVVVGIGTVLADDPLLTARIRGRATNNPVRVIVDSTGRLPVGSQIASSASTIPTIVAVASRVSQERVRAFERLGIEVLVAGTKKVDLAELLAELGKREIISVLVEGGAGLNSSFLELELVDKILFFVAPKVFGPECLNFTAKRSLAPIGFRLSGAEKMGEDLLITGYSTTYASAKALHIERL